MMTRTSKQIVNGILERIPDSAPEKDILVTRFKKFMERPSDMDPRYHPPEMYRQHECALIKKICIACEEVLGNPTTAEWKAKVSLYLRTGR